LIATHLATARAELASNQHPTEEYAAPSVFVMNGLLASVLTGLQSILDSIATFCQREAPDDDVDGFVYFSTYPFHVTTFDFIRPIKVRIYGYSFRGLNFNQLANSVKHELPWLGLLSTNPDGNLDIHDDQGVGLLREVIVPVYEDAKKIIQRLGHKYQQPVTLPFV
jgi:hypothetical protein